MDHAVHERTPRNESFPNCCHHVVIQGCNQVNKAAKSLVFSGFSASVKAGSTPVIRPTTFRSRWRELARVSETEGETEGGFPPIR